MKGRALLPQDSINFQKLNIVTVTFIVCTSFMLFSKNYLGDSLQSLVMSLWVIDLSPIVKFLIPNIQKLMFYFIFFKKGGKKSVRFPVSFPNFLKNKDVDIFLFKKESLYLL